MACVAASVIGVAVPGAASAGSYIRASADACVPEKNADVDNVRHDGWQIRNEGISSDEMYVWCPIHWDENATPDSYLWELYYADQNDTNSSDGQVSCAPVVRNTTATRYVGGTQSTSTTGTGEGWLSSTHTAFPGDWDDVTLWSITCQIPGHDVNYSGLEHYRISPYIP